MNSIQSRIDALIDELGAIEAADERFIFLVDWAKNAKPYPEKYREDVFKVPGCLSSLWIHPSCENGRCYFDVDSDAQIPKGIAVVLAHIFSGEYADDILACDMSFTDTLGISKFLSKNRRNALGHICNYIMSYAAQVAGGSAARTVNA
ncbi:MAG: SufE family protein [Bdellovibrionales bacterium]|nr:SufE family protein [Bdellovibrionales bacterium]